MADIAGHREFTNSSSKSGFTLNHTSTNVSLGCRDFSYPSTFNSGLTPPQGFVFTNVGENRGSGFTFTGIVGSGSVRPSSGWMFPRGVR